MENNNKGGFFYLLKIAYRNLFRNIRRSILCITAISLAVLMIVFLMAYIEGMLDSAEKIAQTFESGHIKITTKEFEKKEFFYPLQYPINNLDDSISKIQNIKGIKAIVPRITTFAIFSSNIVKNGYIAGVNFNNIKKMKNEKIKYAFFNFTKKSDGLLAGRFPQNNKNECIVGYRLAKKMEIIPAIIEYYEFNWILDNINVERNKNLLIQNYILDKNKMIYKLNLINENNLKDTKINKKELKKILAEQKKSYLNLLEIFMNIEIKIIPQKLGINANVLDYFVIKDYLKEFLLTIYDFDKQKNIYILKDKDISSDDKNYLLNKLNSALSLRANFLILSSQYSNMPGDPKIVGIFEFDYVTIDQNFILMPFTKLQKLGRLNNETQIIYVFINNIKQVKKIKKEIINILNNPDLVIKDWTESPFIAMFNQFEFVYFIIYCIFLIVASFLIMNTIIMVIHERIKEIGMMGALGMNRLEIVLVFFLEALFLSIFGALLGTILGGLISGIWSFFPINIESLTGGVEFPVTNTIFIKFSVIILIKGFLFGTIVASICTFFPSIKSAFIEPVEALRR